MSPADFFLLPLSILHAGPNWSYYSRVPHRSPLSPPQPQFWILPCLVFFTHSVFCSVFHLDLYLFDGFVCCLFCVYFSSLPTSPKPGPGLPALSPLNLSYPECLTSPSMLSLPSKPCSASLTRISLNPTQTALWSPPLKSHQTCVGRAWSAGTKTIKQELPRCPSLPSSPKRNSPGQSCDNETSSVPFPITLGTSVTSRISSSPLRASSSQQSLLQQQKLWNPGKDNSQDSINMALFSDKPLKCSLI